MTRGFLLGSILVAIILAGTARAQPPSQSQLDDLENRVTKVESTIDDLASTGFVIFLFGAFCALWAKNSGLQRRLNWGVPMSCWPLCQLNSLKAALAP